MTAILLAPQYGKLDLIYSWVFTNLISVKLDPSSLSWHLYVNTCEIGVAILRIMNGLLKYVAQTHAPVGTKRM